MPRGGRRQGQAGKSYSNRTDLAANRAPTAPAMNVPAPAPPPGGGGGIVSPDATPKPTDPTTYPTRPPTYGAPGGPGAGPEVMSLRGAFNPDPGVMALKRAYATTGDESIRRVLEYYEGLGY